MLITSLTTTYLDNELLLSGAYSSKDKKYVKPFLALKAKFS